MKMNDDDQMEDKFMDGDELMNSSDEFLLHMTEQLNQELSDITVSEDLIAKTLKAVKSEDKKSEDKKSNILSYEDAKASVENRRDNKKEKKDHSKVIVQLVGVAAACFVLFAGARVLSFGGMSKKDECKSESSYDQSEEATALPESSDQGYKGTEEAPSEESAADTTESAKNELSYNMQDSQEKESGMSNDITTAGESDTKDNLLASPPMVEEASALTAAIEAAKTETTDLAYIHTYRGDSDEDIFSKLLMLFSSDHLSLCSEDADDEWIDYIVLSIDDDTAILYKVGKQEYVVAQTYEVTGLRSETVYQVKDMKAFKESLDAATNN